MNKEDMGNTYQQIIEGKFKPVVTTIPSQERIVELLSKNIVINCLFKILSYIYSCFVVRED